MLQLQLHFTVKTLGNTSEITKTKIKREQAGAELGQAQPRWVFFFEDF